MKTKIKIKKWGIVLLASLFLFDILLAFNVYGESYVSYQPTLFSTGTNFQYSQPSFQSFYNQQGIDYGVFWPILSNSETCENRQDFLINIRPGGCQPAVVRSDLLEEQNVPVFCKLDAIKINPIISVAAMKSVTFKGDYPKEIAGVSFHPSDAALRIYTTKLDSPLLNDVGYIVVSLKQTEAEKDMPDFVEANLTAVLQYDMDKALGTGFSSLFVPAMSEAEWQSSYKDYGFWKGRGFVRVESLDKDSATIAIYTDSTNSIQRMTVKKGETSNLIYMPGFYCKAGVQVNLKDVSYPKKRAKINVDGDDVWVTEGSRILSSCSVTSIEKASGGSVALSCPQGTVILSIGAINKAIINGNDIDVGSRIQKMDNGDNIYLAYTGKGKFEISGVEQSFIVVVKNPGNIGTDGIKQESLVKLAQAIETTLGNLANKKQVETVRDIQSTAESELSSSGAKVIFKGQTDNEYKITYNDQAGNSDKDCKDILQSDANCKNLQDYFNAAKKQAIETVRFYGTEKDLNGDIYGVMALDELAKTAETMKMQNTQIEILQEIINNYPNSRQAGEAEIKIKSLREFNYESAGASIRIGYENHYVNLIDVKKPDITDASAVFQITDSFGNPKLETVIIGDYPVVPSNIGTSQEYVKLKDLDSDRATLEYSVVNSQDSKNPSGTFTKELLINDYLPTSVSGNRIRLVKINLNRVAEIELVPKNPDIYSEVNFSLRIGIEKRAIKLTPEETQEKIKNLNKTIAQWEKLVLDLANLIKGWKAACFATSALLIAKNFVENTGGKSMARTIAMRKPGGWFEKCTKEKQETGISMDECFAKHSSEIGSDVSEIADRIQEINKQVESTYVYGKADLFGSTVNSVQSTANFGAGPFTEFLRQHANDKVKIGKDTNTTLFGTKDSVFESEATVNQMIKDGRLTMSDMRDIMLYDSVSNTQIKESSLLATLKPINDKKLLPKLESEFNPALEKLGVDAAITSPEYGKQIPSRIFSIGSSASASMKLPEIEVEKKDKDGRKTTEKVAQTGEYVLLAVPEAAKIVSTGPGQPKQPLASMTGTNLILVPVIAANKDNYMFDSGSGRKVYAVTNNNGNLEQTKEIPQTDVSNILNNMQAGGFTKISRSMCQNKYINANEVRFFEREPYKGRPALVPVDLEDGWYAATKQNLPGFGIKPYSDAGSVESFWLCNVGANGLEEFDNNLNDDICTQVNTFTGQSFSQISCLDASSAQKLVAKAVSLLQEAASQYGKKEITLSGVGRFKSGIASEASGTQCQDYMSPEDCTVMFNVCDPVLCPSSRCNLGGAYSVSDVIQSGIIGSILLCLPNFGSPANGGVLVPVCITGVQAGLDAYVSVMKSYRDCLQENINSGKMVGICDEIYSIYLCEFFWRQAAPLLDQAIPKLIESLYYGKQGVRGGGEYLTVQNAWDNADNSVKYFTNYYAVNAFKAFDIKSTAEVGTEICKAFISTRFPNNKDMLDKLLEPESPVQFYARFDETKYTEATVPSTSQYKVYYHIYGGRDIGHYYSVYLKNPPASGYYIEQPYIQIDSGYVGIAQSVDITKDFTAPSGYKELCVRIDTQEECGFQTVSTSFAANYIKDKYIQDQAAGEITTESGCVSGNPSIYGLVTPSVQGAAENTVSNGLYNKGVIRICSTNDPGASTNPGKWQIVGYCDTNKKVLCWVDTNSVTSAIKNLNIENQTLQDIQDKTKEIANQLSSQAGVWSTEMTSGEFKRVEDKLNDFVKEINRDGYIYPDFGTSEFSNSGAGQIITILDNVILHAYGNDQKAKASYMKYQVYQLLVKSILGKYLVQNKPAGVAAPRPIVNPPVVKTEDVKFGDLKEKDILIKTIDNSEYNVVVKKTEAGQILLSIQKTGEAAIPLRGNPEDTVKGYKKKIIDNAAQPVQQPVQAAKPANLPLTIEFQNGIVVTSGKDRNLIYKFENNKWVFTRSDFNGKWYDASIVGINNVVKDDFVLSDNDQKFLEKNMAGKNYESGINELVIRFMEQNEGGVFEPKLSVTSSSQQKTLTKAEYVDTKKKTSEIVQEIVKMGPTQP